MNGLENRLTAMSRGFESHTLRHFGSEIQVPAPFLFAFLHVLWDARTTFVIFVFKLFFTLLKTAAFSARKLREGLWIKPFFCRICVLILRQ